jgi:hypothetical protein
MDRGHDIVAIICISTDVEKHVSPQVPLERPAFLNSDGLVWNFRVLRTYLAVSDAIE